MAISDLFSFAEPLIFWLLRVVPGPVSTVADLLRSVRDENRFITVDEAVWRLTKRQDDIDVRFCAAIRQIQQGIERILAAKSVPDVDRELQRIIDCGGDGVHTVLSPEIADNSSVRDAFLKNPESYGTVLDPSDEVKPKGLDILGGDKHALVVRPSPSGLFELVGSRRGTRRNLASVSQPEWFEFIRQRKLQGTSW